MKTDETKEFEFASLRGKYPEIKLNKEQRFKAYKAGCSRRDAMIESGKENDGYGKGKTGLYDADINGAGAELAGALYLKIPWEARINNFHAADLLDNLQVRSVTDPRFRLIFRTDDNPDHFYMLVIGKMPYFYPIGFLIGHDCKKLGFWRNPGEAKFAWFVDQHNLKSLDLLDCSSNIAKDKSIII